MRSWQLAEYGCSIVIVYRNHLLTRNVGRRMKVTKFVREDSNVEYEESNFWIERTNSRCLHERHFQDLSSKNRAFFFFH